MQIQIDGKPFTIDDKSYHHVTDLIELTGISNSEDYDLLLAPPGKLVHLKWDDYWIVEDGDRFVTVLREGYLCGGPTDED